MRGQLLEVWRDLNRAHDGEPSSLLIKTAQSIADDAHANRHAAQ
jgi:hypothetical protein